MAFQQYNIYEGLTAARLASTTNVSGTYNNGPSNNGVGATLTIAASSLTVDSVAAAVGDRILLQGQTNANENGLYVVNSIGSTVVLQRAADQQCNEQLKAGQYVSVGAGSLNAGNFYTLVEPLPAILGINNLSYNADPSAGGVSFSGAASTANGLPAFSDTAGNIKVPTATMTSGFGLTSATGNLQATTGNLIAGSSGNAGFLQSFPGSANGSLKIAAVANSGNTITTISNAAMGQASVISIPDPGAATSNFALSQSSAPTNNLTFTKVITAGQADLAAAGKVNVQVHTSATSQFAVLDVKVLKSTGLSGGGGDRLLSLSDGTIVFNNAGITAALLGTPILTVWGGTGNPLAVGASEITTAGADLFLQYTGGANDYTTGSVQLAITLVQVTA